MPIEKIVPDATTATHSTITETDGGTTNIHLALDADDTNYARFTTITKTCQVSFGNLTSDIGSINSIRFYINGYDGAVRSASDVATFKIQNTAGTTYYGESKTFTDRTLGDIQAGTERTTHDGSNVWTEALVNGLRMHMRYDTWNDPSSVLDLDHLYINVDYEEPVVVIPTYDNTLNNITMNLGTTILSGGNIILD